MNREYFCTWQKCSITNLPLDKSRGIELQDSTTLNHLQALEQNNLPDNITLKRIWRWDMNVLVKLGISGGHKSIRCLLMHTDIPPKGNTEEKTTFSNSITMKKRLVSIDIHFASCSCTTLFPFKAFHAVMKALFSLKACNHSVRMPPCGVKKGS